MNLSLLDINMSNYVQVPIHISGDILDLVLTPVGVDLVNRVEGRGLPLTTGFPIMHLSLLSLM